MINDHNRKFQAGEVFSQLRLNQFSDLTVEEFKKTYLSEYPSTGDFTCTGPTYNKTTTFNETFYVEKGKIYSNFRDVDSSGYTRPMHFWVCVCHNSIGGGIHVQNN